MKKLSILVFAAALVSCSSNPKTYATNTEASTEIMKTEKSLQDAMDAQANVFAPKTFGQAKAALETARQDRADNASNETILKDIEKANAFIETSIQKAQIAKTALPGVADARMAALSVEADKNTSKKFSKADDELRDFTSDVEKGSVRNADKIAKELNNKYKALEVDGTLASKLGQANGMINKAKEEGAKEYAPKSWGMATKYYNDAAALIKVNPRNLELVDPAADRAQFEADKLLRVVRKTKAAGGAKAEDVVLQAESQQQYIYQQRNTIAAVRDQKQQVENEAEGLRGVKGLQDRVAAISSKFDAKEAEVYQQDKSVIVRLKGVNFAKGKSEIPSSSYATLKKVQEAIESFDHPKVIVEGHTDATGSSKVNIPLSEKRAESVKNYLTANLGLGDDVEVKGYGFNRPITTNKTKEGRAQNRRIDVIIEQSDTQVR